MDNLVMPEGQEEGQDRFKVQEGIGLYKIRYEMDVKDSAREQGYMVGVIAYTSEEAVNTIVDFARKNVKGFKGMKIEEVSFDGLCHAVSDKVKGAILNTAKLEGLVVSREDFEAATAKTKKTTKKKSIIPEQK